MTRKKNHEFNGVCDLNSISPERQADWFGKIEAGNLEHWQTAYAQTAWHGHQYQKAGVMLSDLVQGECPQADLLGSERAEDARSSRLMDVIDQINVRMGSGTLRLASEGFRQAWKMKQGNKSPSYTTNSDELVCVMKLFKRECLFMAG